MAFSRAHGSLEDEWDYEPLFEGRSTYNPHDVHSSGIAPENQQVLESAFINESHPSARDIGHLPYHRNLDAGTYHLSEHSDSVHATAPLQQSGSIPAQNDGLLFNSGGWVGDAHESIAESGCYSNASFDSRTHQLEAQNYSAPSFLQDIDKASSLNVSTQEIKSNDLLDVPSAGAPWYPGSRVRNRAVLCILIADKSSSSLKNTTPLMLHTIFPELVAPLTASPGSISRRKPLAITHRRLPFPVTYRHTLQPPRPEAQVSCVKAMHPPHHHRAMSKYAFIVAHYSRDDTAKVIVPDTSVSDMPESRARTARAVSAGDNSTVRTRGASTNGRNISSRIPNHALDDRLQDQSATVHS
jgi:hypothetical protein